MNRKYFQGDWPLFLGLKTVIATDFNTSENKTESYDANFIINGSSRQRLSWRQPPSPSVMTKLSSWQLLVFKVISDEIIRQSNPKHTIFWLQHIMIHHQEVGTLWYIIMKSASCPPVFSGPGKQQLPAVEYRKLATCLLLGMSKVMCPPGWEACMQ